MNRATESRTSYRDLRLPAKKESSDVTLYVLLTLKFSRRSYSSPFRDDERVKTVSDYPIIRSISPFTLSVTTVSRDYRVPIRSRPGGEEKKRKERRAGGYTRAHSHPGSDRNGLNAREAPEECRCAHMPRARARPRRFIRPGVCRGIPWKTAGEYIYIPSRWRNPAPVARHASIFINVTGDRVILTDWPYVLSVSRRYYSLRSRWLGGLDSGKSRLHAHAGNFQL